MKKTQHYQNHSQYVPLYHFVLSSLWLAGFIGSIVNVANSSSQQGNLYSAWLILLIMIMLFLIAYFARSFALRAQDRAIRAEENLRHLVLTGKPLPAGLRTGQIIALRFASDEELPTLANRALQEKLSMKSIKQAIQNWRGDYYRV